MNTKRSLPEIPDDDKDFTPDLARKIIAAYQAMILISDASLFQLRAKLDELSAADRVHASARAGFEKRLTDRAEAAEASSKMMLAALTEIMSIRFGCSGISFLAMNDWFNERARAAIVESKKTDSDLGDAHADLVTQYCIDKTGKPDNRGKWKARTEAAEASNKVLIEALTTKQCPKCKGTKGFYDTTYDRTGAWENCHTCDGTGRVFDMKALRKAAVLAGDKGNKG